MVLYGRKKGENIGLGSAETADRGQTHGSRVMGDYAISSQLATTTFVCKFEITRQLIIERYENLLAMKKFQTVDEYISAHEENRESLARLRSLLLSTNLKETVKWGAPVYIYHSKNIVGLGAFKSYTSIWFFQGALLKDEHTKLINAQEGKTKSLRQWRFNSFEEIEDKLILEYVEEAVRNQELGKQIKPSKNKPLIIPPELKMVLDQNSEIRDCFNELSLTNQRDYAEYIREAKRDETKSKRLQKIIPMIKEKKGLNDKYKK